MSKRRYLLCLILFAGFSLVKAQTLGDYTFSTGTDSTRWIPLTTTTSILTSGTSTDSKRSAVLDIGFTFTFGADEYTKFSVNSDGNLRFGTTVTGYANFNTPFSSNNSNANNPKINFFGCNGNIYDFGYVYKEVVGVEPERICVLEFGTSTGASSTSSNLYRWQVQLFEGSNNIQIVYPSTVPSAGPAATRQQGMCVNSSDIWLVKANNTATHYTSGQSSTIASGNWPSANRYYLFTAPAPACPKPTNFHAAQLASDGALLTWQSDYSASTWDLYITTSSTAPTAATTPTVTVYDTFYHVTNLQPGTEYHIYVRSDCGDEQSYWEDMTLKTACAGITQLPYTCGFETVPSGSYQIPECWIRGANNASYPYSSTLSPHTGSRILLFQAANYVTLPPIDTDQVVLQNAQLSFYANSTINNTILQVGVMTDPTNPSTFTLLESLQMTTEYQLYEIPFVNYVGFGAFVALRTTSSTTVRVDDLTLEITPSCSRPTLLSASATQSDALLTWFANGNDFTLYYKPASDSVYTMVQNVTYPYALTGLSQNTDYDWYVEAFCSGVIKTSLVSTFHTACGLLTYADLPYVEDFEAYANTASLSPCLTRISPYNATYPTIFTGTDWSAVTGKMVYFLPQSASDRQYLVMQGVENASGLAVNFYTKRGSSDVVLDLGVMSSPTDTSSFQLIGSYGSVAGSSDWSNFEVPLSAYQGTSGYVAFRARSLTAGKYILVDDITISPFTGCVRPDSVTADNATTNSVQIHVTDSHHAGHYQIVTSSVYGVDTAEVMGYTYTVTGLKPGTVYDVAVSTICGNEVTTPTTSTFSTSCAILTHQDLPFKEDFDMYAYNANALINPCWNRLSFNPDYPVGPYPKNQYTRVPGVGNTFYYYPGAGNAVQYAILPQIAGLSDLLIDFWVYRQTTSPLIEVGVMTDPTDTSTFTLIQSCEPVAASTWEEFDVHFASYNGQGTYIALRARCTGASTFICIDDIEVREDNCAKPQNLMVSQIGNGHATFTWDAVPGAAGYEFVLDGIDTVTLTTNTYTAQGVQPLTDYVARVRTLCDDNSTSNYLSLHFSAPFDSLPYYQNFNNFSSSTSALPIGWQHLGAGSIQCISTGSYLYDSTALRFSGSSNNNIALLPPFPAEISELYLRFKTRPESTSSFSGQFDVGYMTNNADTSSFVALQTYSYASFNNAYQDKFVTFAGAPAGARMAMRHRATSSSWYWFVDNVEVDYDHCPAVSNLTVLDLAAESVTVTWSPVAVSTSYLLNLNGQQYTTTDTFYTFNNLYQATDYTLEVSTLCGSDESPFSTSTQFTTPMIVQGLPYTADFSAADGWLMNSGSCVNFWKKGPVDENTNGLFVTSGTNPGYAISSASSVTAEKHFLVGDEPTFIISFDLLCGGESSYDYLKVFFAPVTQNYSAGTGTQTWTDKAYSTYAFNFSPYFTYTSTSSSYPYIINLTNNNTIHVEFLVNNPVQNPDAMSEAKLVFGWRNDNSGGTNPGPVITNLKVKAETCKKPTAVTMTDVYATSVNVAWNAPEYASSYILQYALADVGWDDPTAVVMNVIDTNATLTGLTPNTTYQLRVATDCSDDTSMWVTTTFTTSCEGIDALPFFCDFESVPTGSNQVPQCWTKGSNHATYPYVSSSSTAFSGDHHLYFNNANTIALPPVDEDVISLNTTQVSFHAKGDGYKLLVGVMTNPSDASSFVTVDTVTLTATYEYYMVSLSTYMGNGRYVALKNIATNAIYVDDLVLGYIPSCPTPFGLLSLNPTSTSVEVTWGGSSPTYNLYYAPYGDNTFTMIPNVDFNAGNTITLSGLTPGTVYQWYVSSICPDNTESFSMTVGTFTTECDVLQQLPHTWDFETYDYTTLLPRCWSALNPSASGPKVMNDYGYSGNNSLRLYANTPISTVVLPQVDSALYALNNLKMTFYAMNSGSYAAWHVRIIGGVMTDPMNDSTFVPVDTISVIGAAGGSYQFYTLSLNSYQGPAGYPAIQFERVEGAYWLNVDDFTLDVIKAYPEVTTDGTTDVMATTATLHAIVSNPDTMAITARGFEWKMSSGGTYAQIAGSGTGPVFTADLTGLTPNTSYTFRAFVTCGAVTLYGEEESFTTLETSTECPAPTDLRETGEIVDKAPGFLFVEWTDNAGASQWNLQYRLQGSEDWTTVVVNNNPRYSIVAGLEAYASYELRVQAVCGNGIVSEWSNILVAVAQGTGMEDYLAKAVTLYPNPATEVVSVAVSDANIMITGVEVYNVYGQIVETFHGTSLQGRATLNVSGLADGMYYVRVTTDNGVVTKNFVKK